MIGREQEIVNHGVLIVDDSGLMRNTIRQIVAADEQLVVVGEAEDGLVAIGKDKELKPQVILLDIEMPRLDGLGAMKRLSLRSRAKIVILSSLAQLDSPAALEARRLGAFEIIAKPSGTISLDLKAKRGHEIVRVVRAAAGLPPLDLAAMYRKAQRRKEEQISRPG
jgi:two-component system chemotaxis response regulator CheB